MKTTLSVLLLLAATIASGCGSATNAEQSVVTVPASGSRAYLHAFNLPSHGVALEGYCPVAYFAVNKAVPGKPEHASTHEGVTYYFVSAEAQRAFEENPAKYVPAYGGWCAFGMAASDKFPADPTNFKIVDGKLMVFLRNPGVDALDLWNRENQKALVTKADRHWRTVQG